MMARFQGLSRVETPSFDLHGVDGKPLYIGHGPSSEPRVPYIHPTVEPVTKKGYFGRDFFGGFKPPWTQAGPGPSGETTGAPPANVQGASTPDLLVVPGQQAGGGGPSLGSLALLALVGVGGWWAWKKWGPA